MAQRINNEEWGRYDRIVPEHYARLHHATVRPLKRPLDFTGLTIDIPGHRVDDRKLLVPGVALAVGIRWRWYGVYHPAYRLGGRGPFVNYSHREARGLVVAEYDGSGESDDLPTFNIMLGSFGREPVYAGRVAMAGFNSGKGQESFDGLSQAAVADALGVGSKNVLDHPKPYFREWDPSTARIIEPVKP